MSLSSEEARELNNIIDEKDGNVLNRLLNWDLSATIISVGAGTAIVHLPTDPAGENITVQNPNEISLEVGDQVTIHKINGNINNSYILFRKTVVSNTIYVDYNIGTDLFGRDSSGNLYGSLSAPFKTLQYAVGRLPKNLNRRDITIRYANPNSAETLEITDFYGGGTLTIAPTSGTTVSYIDYIYFFGCIGVEIDVYYLGATNLATSRRAAIWIRNSSYVVIDHCNVITSSPTKYGISVDDGSRATVRNTIISNRNYGLIVESTAWCLSQDNSDGGATNTYGLVAFYASYLGKIGTQPTGSYADSSSTIK